MSEETIEKLARELAEIEEEEALMNSPKLNEEFIQNIQIWFRKLRIKNGELYVKYEIEVMPSGNNHEGLFPIGSLSRSTKREIQNQLRARLGR